MIFKHKNKKEKINNQIDFCTENYTSDFLQGLDLTSTNYSLKLSAVYSCINILSNDFGKLPFKIINTITKEIDSLNRANYLLSVRPNKNMTPFVFKKLMMVNILIYGNAFAYIKTDMYGFDEELIILEPNYVNIKKDENDNVFYEYTKNAEQKLYNSDEIIHLKGMSGDGLKGESVLTYARNCINTGLNQENFSSNFFKKGGRPQGTLTTEADLGAKVDENGKTAKDILRESWEKANAGIDNINRIAVLDRGLKYTAIPQITQADMEFVASKELNVGDICRFFNIPKFLLGIGKESYSSNEQNMIAYITQSFSSWATQAEQEFTFKLLSEKSLIEGNKIKANLKVFLRGDTQTQKDWYSAMIEKGIYSVNDVRDLEDLKNIKGGDIHYASLNYVPLEDFKQLSQNRNKGENNINEKV